MFIGVDVGGTNSDAVVLKGKNVLCWEKVPTTGDITTGVRTVMEKILEKIPATENKTDIQHVSIGTTHFVNAVIQKRGLVPVSVIRLCGSASTALPPFVDIPKDLTKVIKRDVFLAQGGFYVDGKVFREVDKDEIREIAEKLKETSTKNVVVSGIYSPVNPEQEETVSAILREIIPDISITLSHTIGHMGLLERENASILNECLKPLCRKTLSGFVQAVSALGLKCPMYLTQNDGTLVGVSTCLSYPVCTFASGPTNSMRGAAFLSDGGSEAVVIDVGGTTTDVGQLVKGFPRQAANKVKIGGVYTNFRMPDLFSIGLGGGSIVDVESRSVGPLSVGHQLTAKAQCFGGETLTATDVALKAGICSMKIGNKDAVQLDNSKALEAMETIGEMIAKAVDMIKHKASDVPLIAVGGGAILVDTKRPIPGVSELIIPDHFQVANAVGAALGQVSGTFDQVMVGKTRQEALAIAKAKAIESAISAGADEETTSIVEVTETPLSYLPSNAVRYSVRAVGNLKPVGQAHLQDQSEFLSLGNVDAGSEESELNAQIPEEVSDSASKSGQSWDRRLPYSEGPEWKLNYYDIEAIKIGAGILGCGGGGSAYIGWLRTLEALKEGQQITIVRPEKHRGGHAIGVSFMGAPTVMIERLMNGRETLGSMKGVERVSGLECTSLLCCEIGGANAMEPLALAAKVGLPVVDADGMGRAFPELQMILPLIRGKSANPCVLYDDKDSSFAVLNCDGPKHNEDICRNHCINFMGCAAAFSMLALTHEEVVETCILNSYSRAWLYGDSVLQAHKSKQCPIEAIVKAENGKVLLGNGKIIDVERRTTGGFARGVVIIQDCDNEDTKLRVNFQNENLMATLMSNGQETLMGTTPNLIVIVETDSGNALQTEELRYGLRVTALRLASPPELLDDRSLDVVGPRAFGYDFEVV